MLEKDIAVTRPVGLQQLFHHGNHESAFEKVRSSDIDALVESCEGLSISSRLHSYQRSKSQYDRSSSSPDSGFSKSPPNDSSFLRRSPSSKISRSPDSSYSVSPRESPQKSRDQNHEIHISPHSVAHSTSSAALASSTELTSSIVLAPSNFADSSSSSAASVVPTSSSAGTETERVFCANCLEEPSPQPLPQPLQAFQPLQLSVQDYFQRTPGPPHHLLNNYSPSPLTFDSPQPFIAETATSEIPQNYFGQVSGDFQTETSGGMTSATFMEQQEMSICPSAADTNFISAPGRALHHPSQSLFYPAPAFQPQLAFHQHLQQQMIYQSSPQQTQFHQLSPQVVPFQQSSTVDVSFEGKVPPHMDARRDYSKNMELVWDGWFQALFSNFTQQHGHLWKLVPYMLLEAKGETQFLESGAGHGWSDWKDSAKVRFACDKCNHGWTSMKGRVNFWLQVQPDGACRAVFKLFGQQCQKCNDSVNYHAMWYPEEVKKVIINLYHHVNHRFYNGPKHYNPRRAKEGKPQRQHDSQHCQACQMGKCQQQARGSIDSTGNASEDSGIHSDSSTSGDSPRNQASAVSAVPIPTTGGSAVPSLLGPVLPALLAGHQDMSAMLPATTAAIPVPTEQPIFISTTPPVISGYNRNEMIQQQALIPVGQTSAITTGPISPLMSTAVGSTAMIPSAASTALTVAGGTAPAAMPTATAALSAPATLSAPAGLPAAVPMTTIQSFYHTQPPQPQAFIYPNPQQLQQLQPAAITAQQYSPAVAAPFQQQQQAVMTYYLMPTAFGGQPFLLPATSATAASPQTVPICDWN